MTVNKNVNLFLQKLPDDFHSEHFYYSGKTNNQSNPKFENNTLNILINKQKNLNKNKKYQNLHIKI